MTHWGIEYLELKHKFDKKCYVVYYEPKKKVQDLVQKSIIFWTFAVDSKNVIISAFYILEYFGMYVTFFRLQVFTRWTKCCV